jgi:hypothetical protein
MRKKRPAQTHFLNVDLDIRARVGLPSLIKAMASSVVVLSYQPRRFLCVELAAIQPKDIDGAVRSYFDLVELFGPSDRLIWDRCESRIMNIGIQAATAPYQAEFKISQDAVGMLGQMRAEIKITVYGCVT